MISKDKCPQDTNKDDTKILCAFGQVINSGYNIHTIHINFAHFYVMNKFHAIRIQQWSQHIAFYLFFLTWVIIV